MAGADLKADLWISEYISPWDVRLHGVNRVLAAARTDFQDMQIVESGLSGKGLVLDGKWQSCTGDEFLYHEPLVHAPCVAHGAPKSVLVLGGGEGATVREALRWKSVRRVTMVDIDGEVVEACKEHLPEMHQGAFDDARTELIIGDALKYLDDAQPTWDVIISDLSDPIEDGPSFALFTKEYFEKVQRALAPGGVFVLQAGPVSPPEVSAHARLASTVRAVFAHTRSLISFAPSYGAPWSFVLGSAEPIEIPDEAGVDALLAAQVVAGLRMFDGESLHGMLRLPKHIREAIAGETAVFTLADPRRFFGAGAVNAV